MWDDGVINRVARVFVARVLSGDWIAHTMTQMDTGVTKSDSCECRGEEHLFLRFEVFGISDGAGEIFDCTTQRI